MKKYRPHQKTLLAVVLSMAALMPLPPGPSMVPSASRTAMTVRFCYGLSRQRLVSLRISQSAAVVAPLNLPVVIWINNTSYPSSVMCNSQSQYQSVQTTVATSDIQSVINSLKENKKVNMSTFGSSLPSVPLILPACAAQ
jgi:hypothetical protein